MICSRVVLPPPLGPTIPVRDRWGSERLTPASAWHDELWQALAQPGQLTLSCKLNLWHMLRPAVQPGSTLDFTPPPETVTVVLESPEPLTVKASTGTVSQSKGRVLIQVNPKEGEPVSLTVFVLSSWFI